MRDKELKLFLYWIEERHNIFIKKEAGEDRPWTGDPILNEYKFTNPFRENDRVTRELRKRIKKKDNLVTVFTKIIIFRMFNWPPTYDALDKAGLVDKWDTRKATSLLTAMRKQERKIFTGAYIITNSGSKKGKIDIMCKAIGKILSNMNLLRRIQESKSLEESCLIMQDYPMVGKFIAYELITDMRHTKILNKATDIYTWANPGPGCKRGVHRLLFGTTRGEKPKGKDVDYQQIMRELMHLAQHKLGDKLDVKFEMRDIEHSLCEFDKYMRVLNKEGKPRSKYK